MVIKVNIGDKYKPIPIESPILLLVILGPIKKPKTTYVANTLKLKRRVLNENYKKEIDAMYAE